MSKPGMTEKTIVGAVPVLPGLPASPLIIDIPIDDYDIGTGDKTSMASGSSMEPTMIGVASIMVGGPPSATSSKQEPPKWKLKHVDFMPQLLKEKKEEEYEKFSLLLKKANKWMSENPHALVFTAETMTWMNVDKPVYTDNGVVQKCMQADKRTRVSRGIRLWYFTLDDTFYDKTASKSPAPIGCFTYAVQSKNDSLYDLLLRLNRDIQSHPVPGKIVRVETLSMPSDITDMDVSSWKEQPDKDRNYNFYLRVYYMERMADARKYSEISVQDFIPIFDQRTVHNQGYEVFADLWKRAARWMHLNSTQKVISIQSLYVKYKKGMPESGVWDRLNYQEHGSAYGTMASGSKTEYMQILRIVYSQATSKEEMTASSPKKMFYKTFTPVRLRKPGTGGDSEELTEASYEDLRMVEDKVNSWMEFSGAKVFGIETAMARLRTGGQEALGQESTFVYNQREKNISRELWRYSIRLYLEGEFKEVPVSWTRQIVEQSTSVGNT